MASWETLVAFATLTILVAYFPGPALLYTAAQTISHGRRARFMTMLLGGSMMIGLGLKLATDKG